MGSQPEELANACGEEKLDGGGEKHLCSYQCLWS